MRVDDHHVVLIDDHRGVRADIRRACTYSAVHTRSDLGERVSLVQIAAAHPEPGRLQVIAADLDLPLSVETGPTPALVATIRTMRGVVDLR